MSIAEASALNAEFNRQLRDLGNAFKHFGYREKMLATEWMSKLKKENATTVEAMKRRNHVMEYFILHSDRIFRTEPFNNVNLINEPLHKLRRYMPVKHTAPPLVVEEGPSPIAEMLESCPDGGQFLSTLPVPKDGIFFVTILHQNPGFANPNTPSSEQNSTVDRSAHTTPTPK